MLDVHPPHSPTHTWKDFFIHIATITVGLLIAVSLEQTVEAIHRHRERTDLRESLDHESEQILRDIERVEIKSTVELPWIHKVEDQVSQAALHRVPIGPLPPQPTTSFDVPDDPIYKAAQTGTRIILLDEQETVAYGELDTLVRHVQQAFEHRQESRSAVERDRRNLNFARNPPLPGSPYSDPLVQDNLPVEKMATLYSDFITMESDIGTFQFWSRQARGAATAIHKGERDLHKIEAAEHQFDRLP